MDTGKCVNFRLLRDRWRVSLTGRGTDPKNPLIWKRLENLRAEAMAFYRSLNREENRTCLWPDLPDPENVYVRDRICLVSLRRIRAMALSLKTPGCLRLPREEQRRFLEDILDALDFLYGNWYNEVCRKGGEWWHKEIGIPLCLNECILLLYEELRQERRSAYIRAVESYTKDPDWMCIEDIPEMSTGANRVWKCTALAGCGILKEDAALLHRASDKIRSVFCYASSGDGFYPDGSFIQHHKFPYTGGYGVSFLETIVSYLVLTEGTPWDLQTEEREILLDWVYNGFVPLIFRGAFMSMVRGREIAREETQEHVTGHMLIRALLKLSDCLPEEAVRDLKRILKAWIAQDDFHDFFAHSPLDQIAGAEALLGEPRIEPFVFPDLCKIYASMDRVVHHRKHYALGISMSSERTGRYESIHEENLRGWYTSEGMVYLYNSDLSQFSGGFFPTVDARRMPGTTVDTGQREEKGIGFGKEPPVHTQWCGGACLHHRYGAVGMELQAQCSDLRARKSWFLFDDEILCLGAGIMAHSGRPIETIVENRKNPGTMTIGETADGCPRFVHLGGPVPGSGIGYWFPEKQRVLCFEEDRTDCWAHINHNSGSDRMIVNSFATIVLDHGVDPENGGYSYALLPGLTVEETRAYADSPQIEILRNDAELQEVRHKKLDILGVNVWEKEGGCVEGIRCSGKASLMLQRTADTIALAVADPTQKNGEGITITLQEKVSEVLSCDERITVEQLRPCVQLRVHTEGTCGRTMEVQLKR